MLSPDFFEADTYLPYTSDEYTFLIRWQADLDLRIGLFAASTILYKYTPMAIAYYAYTASAARISSQPGPQMPFVQGHGENWEDDGFAGQLVGNTLLACMLEKSGDGDGWTLDLSGAGTFSRTCSGDEAQGCFGCTCQFAESHRPLQVRRQEMCKRTRLARGPH